MKAFKPIHDQPERTDPPFAGGRAGRPASARDVWWRFLDRWERSRSFRRVIRSLLALAVIVAGIAFWGYPWWMRRNAVRLAQQWLASGHYKYAVEAVEDAMLVAPDSPEPWMLAAELARRGGQNDRALEYTHHAAQLAPANADLQIAWAAEAVRIDKPDEARLALSILNAEELARSPHAQRILGELARRQVRLTEAETHFEAALALDGPGAIDEIPLGVVLLNAADPGERRRGLILLTKWTADPAWGAVALRALLKDAMDRNEPAATAKWAEALRTNPGCTLSDMPNCLLGLARADEARFASVLATMEKDHAVTPAAALQLLSWLNQIGRSAEAVKWMQTLPAEAMQRPPLAVAAAEALRQVGDWGTLQAWVQGKDWGRDAEFLRWAYAMETATRLGQAETADEHWRTLSSHAQRNSAHALFAASTLYSWGHTREAEVLWWSAADQGGKIALDALGSLARHYQVQRDAEGQYRVFRQLYLRQPQNAAIRNNFAFFAALTGREQRQGELAAQANLDREPHNPVYLATSAFTFFMQNRAAESLALLKPVAADAPRSPALAFAYGLALAGNAHQAEGRVLLKNLPPQSLTTREVELIRMTLGD